MAEPLPLEELREVARKNRSVNVDLASYHELRWHDPYFLSLRERWGNAQAAWKHEWFEKMSVSLWPLLGSVYNPAAEKLPEPHAAVAREYIEARELYLGALDHYLREGVGDPS